MRSRRIQDPEGGGGFDSVRAWAVSLRERGSGLEHTTRVDLVRGRAVKDLPDECRVAVHSNGKAALTPYLDDETPPVRVVISDSGIHKP